MNLDHLLALPQYLLPQHLLSRLVGKISQCQQPAIKNFIIKQFIRSYRVEMSEAIQTDPKSYKNFNDFFTRHLQEDKRPIASGADEIAAPVDGSICQTGNMSDGRLFQAKKFHFTLEELLGGNARQAKLFENGKFITIYLAPKDYHRIHMPFTGKLQSMTYIPGRLFSVNSHTTQTIPKLFARNERVVCLFETDFGPLAVILVGAILVGSIHTAWAGQVTPSKNKQIQTWGYLEKNSSIVINKGEEIGHFQMGSTVILLFPENTIECEASTTAGSKIRMGQSVARIL